MPSETRSESQGLRAFLDKDRLSPLYQSVGEILADALERAERHGRDGRRPNASIFATADAICDAIRATLRDALAARPVVQPTAPHPRAAGLQTQERTVEQRATLHCYFIDDGGAEAYVAAEHAGEALHVYVSLQGGDCDSGEFTVSLVPDDKVPDFKIQQSEDAERPAGYTLREMLEKARRGGRAEILSTSEF